MFSQRAVHVVYFCFDLWGFCNYLILKAKSTISFTTYDTWHVYYTVTRVKTVLRISFIQAVVWKWADKWMMMYELLCLSSACVYSATSIKPFISGHCWLNKQSRLTEKLHGCKHAARAPAFRLFTDWWRNRHALSLLLYDLQPSFKCWEKQKKNNQKKFISIKVIYEKQHSWRVSSSASVVQ